MRPISNIQSESINVNILHFWSFVRWLVLPLALALPLAAVAAPQETYSTPEAAVEALMAALKADSDAAVVAVFGEDHKNLVINPDPVQGRANRARILAAMQTMRGSGHVVGSTPSSPTPRETMRRR